MSSIMLSREVVGPSSRFSKVFPVVTNVTQITKDVMLLMVYYQYIRHYPSRHADLIDGGGGGGEI